MPKLLIIFLFLSFAGCTQTQTIERVSGKTMGTTYTIKSSKKIDQQLVDQRLEKINKIFSSWDQQSELSQVNQQPMNQAIVLSDELSQVLNESVRIHKQTNGFFDPGLGDLVDIWGFGAIKVQQNPSRERVSQVLSHVSIAKTTLNQKKLIKHANVKLNLSAIAKGYAVDEIAKLLINQGVDRFMVEIGGEVKAKGSWTIGIEAPVGQPPIAIDLVDESIATSGNYRQYFVWQGKRYAHILDPHTGLPVDSDLFSASVVHQSNMLADAYATAMMAMGSVEAAKMARQLELKTVLILNKCSDPCLSQNIIKIGL